MTKQLRTYLPGIAAILLTVAILVVTLSWFRENAERNTEATTEKYLFESTRAIAALFNTKLEDQVVMLESQVRYLENDDLSDYNAMKRAVMSTKGIGAFKTIGAANSVGATINYNGQSSGNILLTDYFTEAMQGRTAVSRTAVTDEHGESVLAVAVPIVYGGKPVGVMYGTFGKSVLSELVDTVNFAADSLNVLLSDSGSVIACSDNDSFINDGVEDLYSLTGIEQPKNGETKVGKFVVRDTKLLAVFIPLDMHGWYIASLVPESVVTDQTSAIAADAAVVIGAVSLAFIILFVVNMRLMKRYWDMSRSNEKLKLVSSEKKDIVFDYNYKIKQLVLDGDTSVFIADSKAVYSRDEAAQMLKLIHREDRELYEKLRGLAYNRDSKLFGEMRLLGLDGEYHWYRLKANVIRAHDGSPQQAVGMLINTDERRNIELMLAETAEYDRLTGILNRRSFCGKVDSMLAESTDSDMFALYIIDIDGFKSVNDVLGHEMADRVLTDTAKKLCILFSDMDVIGRIGGDEFAVFLRLTTKARNGGMNLIRNKAQAICSKLADTYHLRDKEASVTVSVGAAIFPYCGRTYDTLSENAEKALKHVKSGGKNGCCIYSLDIHD